MPSGTHGAMASPEPIPQPSHRGAPMSNNAQQAVSPPSKEQLRSWWTKFGRKKDKPEDQAAIHPGIFGVPLSQSILYANVAISLTNEQGESFIYGYVPIVVAKCGVFLKEKATDVEGIFRLSGSAKRIKDLQNVFNSPDRYGKGLDWTGYTVHDAANILRRYLNQLPEPIVPLSFYERFRGPLRAYQAKVGDNTQAQAMESEEHGRAVRAYQQLITELPALNRQLLLYILDLLAVFASKSDLNRMTAQNLAAIFQPGIISHPKDDMAPNEYRLSQDVLIFLIENQDNFLIGMTGTAMDEQMKQEVKSGPPSIKTPKAAAGIGRSASTASAGADSIRRTAGVRRNGSLNSHSSRDRSSPGVSSPGTPVSPSNLGTSTSNAGALGRSNTVPSNRSPHIAAQRFQRIQESNPQDTSAAMSLAPIGNSPPDQISAVNEAQNLLLHNTDVRLPPPQQEQPGHRAEQPGHRGFAESRPVAEPASSLTAAQDLLRDSVAASNGKPNSRERKISNLLPRSPLFGPSDQPRDPNQRQPRKLQKRRIPGSLNESAHGSNTSLNADEAGAFHTPLLTPNNVTQERPNPMESHDPSISNAQASVTSERNPSRTLMPPHSPTPSIHSRGSATEASDVDALDDPIPRQEKKQHRFRLSTQRKGDEPLVLPPPIGQNPGARTSRSSLGSNQPRKSFTGDSQFTQTSTGDATSAGYPSATSRESSELLKDPYTQPEKKGLFAKFKAKINQSQDERREREAERERAKSPPRMHPGESNSKNSLNAFAHEHLAPRGRSFDRQRDELPPVQEKPSAEKNETLSQVYSASQPRSAPPMSAPVSAAPQQGQLSTPMSAPVSSVPQQVQPTLPYSSQPESQSAPSTIPVMAATPAPVPILAPGAVPGQNAAPKPTEIPTQTQAQTTTGPCASGEYSNVEQSSARTPESVRDDQAQQAPATSSATQAETQDFTQQQAQ